MRFLVLVLGFVTIGTSGFAFSQRIDNDFGETSTQGWEENLSSPDWDQCSELKHRDDCLQNPNCNWNDSAKVCVEINFFPFLDENL